MLKKFLFLVIISFCFCGFTFAEEAKTPINFIYIHGSDQGTVEEFDIWISRMHPNMKKNLEASDFIQEHLLKNAYINPEQDMLYWADKTKRDKSLVEIGLQISKLASSCVAQLARTTLAHLLHDAIWLQKYPNMKPILGELNQKIIENKKNGIENILVGYSAGTFITYQYLLSKSRNFEATEFFKIFQKQLGIDSQDMAVLESQKIGKTCIDAIVDSNVAIMSADGNLIPVSNKTELRKNMSKLKAQTELSCAPKDSIKGIINFGSPIVIFYSDNFSDDSQMYYFYAKMYQSVVENNQFTLTVNYKKDPLGVPLENINFEDMKKYDVVKDTVNGGGFSYDTAVNGGVIFVSSHLKYWDQTNHFTKAIAKSYEEGYKYFYGLDK